MQRRTFAGMRKLLTFYRRLLSKAFWHSFGVADFISTLLGITLPLVAKLFPKEGGAMSDLTWQIPLTALSAIFIIRLLLAPYWIYEESEEKSKQIADEKKALEKQLEPQLDIVFEPQYPFIYENSSRGTREIRVGIKNIGGKDIARVKVQIDDIPLGGKERTAYSSIPLALARISDVTEFPLASEETEYVAIAYTLRMNQMAFLRQKSREQIPDLRNNQSYTFMITALSSEAKPCRKQASLKTDEQGKLDFTLHGIR